MKQIVYTTHLKRRLVDRLFPIEHPRLIYNNPDETYFDQITKSKIAIKQLQYNGKKRNIMIAYIETAANVKILTIHPHKRVQTQNRIESGRWKPI